MARYEKVPAEAELTEQTITFDDDVDAAEEVTSGDMFSELRVLDIKGRTFSIKNVPLSSTVLQFKIRLAQESEVPVELQRLIYGGKVMQSDSQKLTEVGVKENTVIHLFQRPNKRPVSSTVSPSPSAPPPPSSGSSASNNGNDEESRGNEVTNPMAPVIRDASIVMDGDGTHVPPILEHGRRVKCLAMMLLILSGMNVVSVLLTLLDALVDPSKHRDTTPLLFELMINGLGVIVAAEGLKATVTLNSESVNRYCYGLIVVGVSQIILETWSVLHEYAYEKHHPEEFTPSPTPAPEDDHKESPTDDYFGPPDPDAEIGPALFSVFFAACIWFLCFIRAFQFRAIVHQRDNTN